MSLCELREIGALPSIEAQLIAWVDFAVDHPVVKPVWLETGELRCYVRYYKTLPNALARHSSGEALVISEICFPNNPVGERWFLCFVQLCCLLAKDLLVFEQVIDDELYDLLSQHPAFEADDHQNFVFKKERVRERPSANQGRVTV